MSMEKNSRALRHALATLYYYGIRNFSSPKCSTLEKNKMEAIASILRIFNFSPQASKNIDIDLKKNQDLIAEASKTLMQHREKNPSCFSRFFMPKKTNSQKHLESVLEIAQKIEALKPQ